MKFDPNVRLPSFIKAKSCHVNRRRTLDITPLQHAYTSVPIARVTFPPDQSLSDLVIALGSPIVTRILAVLVALT
jgi:hypothetical protein